MTSFIQSEKSFKISRSRDNRCSRFRRL